MTVKKFLILFLGILQIFSASPATLLCEDLSSDPFEQKEKLEEVTFSDLFRSRRNEAYKGVVLANFIYIDPEERFIYVKPQEDNLPKLTIYIDKKTLFSTMKLGKIGKAKKSMMLEGDRVAIRAMVKNGVILADEVFLVEGDFGPKARFAKRKYAPPPGAPGAAAKKEAKKPEKKSGGGH
jgi:hypothetical protein